MTTRTHLPLISLAFAGALGWIPSLSAQPLALTDTVHWAADSSFADTYLRAGKRIYVYAADSLVISVSMTRDADYLRAQVYVANLAHDRFEVDPSTFVLHNEDDTKPKLRKYRSPQEVAKALKRRAEWGAVFQVIAADLDRDEVTTTTDVDLRGSTTSRASYPASTTSVTGSVTSTTRAPNEEGRRRAAREADRMVSAAAANAAEVLDRALQATTLFFDEESSGAVYFEKDSKGRRFSLVVPARRGVVRIPITLK